MVAMPCAIAFSTSARWVSMRVTMSTRSIFSLPSISSTVAVPVRHAEFRRGRLRLGRVDVADRDEVDALAGKVLPGMQMIAGEEAAADERDASSSQACLYFPPEQAFSCSHIMGDSCEGSGCCASIRTPVREPVPRTVHATTPTRPSGAPRASP